MEGFNSDETVYIKPDAQKAPKAANPREQKEQKKITAIKTAKGSTYTYLPDGRTQRYKEAEENPEKRLQEPMDILVFIPPWEWVKEEAQKRYPQVFGGVENWAQYQQKLLEYAQEPNKTIRVSGRRGGKVLKSMTEVRADEQPILHFLTKGEDGSEREDFALPAAKDPKEGWYTFDDRYWEQDGVEHHEKHMGSKVVAIEYEK